MGRKFDFKYLVIGSGPAGSAAALALAHAKKRVGLIEGGAFGGANLNTRDIPYGVTLDFAHTYYKALNRPELHTSELTFSFPSIITRQLKAVIESGGGNNAKLYEDAGLICIRGYANFLDDHTVAVGDRKFTSEYFILATGAKPNLAGVSGTDTVNYLLPDTALKIRRLPKAVIVIGGGSTGCELAEYYATLGAQTIIMESAPRLLPTEDPEASEAITRHFADHLGVMVLTGSRAVALSQDSYSKYVVFTTADHTEKMVRVDCIVLATGTEARAPEGLANTNVKLDKSGFIKVNNYFETSAKHIYAIGDCTSHDSSTERADYAGRLLATNLIGKSKRSPANYLGFPRVTNTLPAVVTLGLSENELRREHRRSKKSVVYLKDIPAGKLHHTQHGFVKLLADHSGHIVGATLVTEDAVSLAGELSLAIRHRLTALELASTPHAMNDYGYAIQLAAKKLVVPNQSK